MKALKYKNCIYSPVFGRKIQVPSKQNCEKPKKLQHCKCVCVSERERERERQREGDRETNLKVIVTMRPTKECVPHTA